MFTVAYCRVSTEEQAAEGFSIAGQADKLRVYAELHDLGEVVVISDPGLSYKNLERPGLQQVLHMVDEGHVANVLTWRLDRLSRNLGDLIMLADRFGQAGVALHSFTEKIDRRRRRAGCSTTSLGLSPSSTVSSWPRTCAWACSKRYAKGSGSTGPRPATTSSTASSSPTTWRRWSVGSSPCEARAGARASLAKTPASTTQPCSPSSTPVSISARC